MGLFVREVRVHPTGGQRPVPVDLLIAGDRIAAIRPMGELRPGADDVVLEGEGRFLSPPLVDPHVHMDAVLTVGEPRYNESGTLIEGILTWAERKPSPPALKTLGGAQAILREAAQGPD